MKKLLSALIAVAMFATLAATLTGCSKDTRGIQGNMVDWKFNELIPGDVYAEISVRGYEGVMRFVLFEEIAPEAVAAFIANVESDYYFNKTFHRVLEDIFIQGGAFNIDGSDITARDEDKFLIEPHTNARNFYGALAYAPDEHTGRNFRQFYIVTANKPVNIDVRIERLDGSIADLEELMNTPEVEITDKMKADLAELKALRVRLSAIPAAARERYSEHGGYFALDGTVTVFGQMIDGWELLREIAAVQVVSGNEADDWNVAIAPPGAHGRSSRPAQPVVIEKITVTRIPVPTPETEEG